MSPAKWCRPTTWPSSPSDQPALCCSTSASGMQFWVYTSCLPLLLLLCRLIQRHTSLLLLPCLILYCTLTARTVDTGGGKLGPMQGCSAASEVLLSCCCSRWLISTTHVAAFNVPAVTTAGTGPAVAVANANFAAMHIASNVSCTLASFPCGPDNQDLQQQRQQEDVLCAVAPTWSATADTGSSWCSSKPTSHSPTGGRLCLTHARAWLASWQA